ncbi:hypothetical protein TRFO_21189 [Tritrichomonas foetus]|uniref:Uncharacterized protein n=1 Tax=Tritrichomonas foetus TaxID=1144522 RepID=A0A1J4KJA5_9EUKA|nr:hypothetical protein TRFO_21189 [Tritrichomonas foetus]|eukprot:OHT09766.1 hypothetical protein TRFO_21189 [Tritrichomonas foetus]
MNSHVIPIAHSEKDENPNGHFFQMKGKIFPKRFRFLAVTSSMSKAAPQFTADSDLHSHISDAVQQLNSEITDDNPATPYLATYNKMFYLFDEAYQRNLKLVQFCREMNSVVIVNANKISDILKYTTENRNILETLKSEYDKAKLQLELSQTGESETREELINLRKQYLEIKKALQPSEEVHKELERNEQIVSDIHEQIETTNQLLNDIQSDQIWFQNEIDRMETDLQNCEDQILTTIEEKNQTKEDIKIIENKIENFSDEKESKINPIEEKRKNVNELQQINNDMMVQIQSMKMENSNIRQKNSKHPNKLRELKKFTQGNIDKKIFLDNQIKKISQNIIDFNNQDVNLSQDYESNLAEYTRLYNQHMKNQQEKAELMEKSRQMRLQLINLQFLMTKKANDNKTNNRVLMQEKVEASNQRKEFQEEIFLSHKMNNMTNNITTETTHKKQSLARMKEKISKLNSEIYAKTIETNDIQTKILNIHENVENGIIENNNLLEKHKYLKTRIDQQTELIDKLVQEKMQFKRQFEKTRNEQSELQSQYDQLVSSIEMMTDKIDKIIEDTKMSKVMKVEANITSESLDKMKTTALEGIEASRNATQKLQAEQRSLTRVLEETDRNHTLHVKEYHIVVNNLEMLKSQLDIKKRQSEQLKSEIDSGEAYRQKSEKLFNENMKQIFKLQDELKAKQKRTAELEKKVDHVIDLQNEEKRFIDMLAIERKRKMTLYGLFNSKIHITPSMITGAVDNETVLQHQYYLNLNQRIVDAMNTLEGLQKTRDELQKKLDTMKERMCNFTVDQVKDYIQTYNENLKEKEKEIAKYQELLRGNLNEAAHKREKNEAARLQVSQRKSIAQSLKQSNRELRNELESFITEPSVVMYPESSPRLKNMSRVPSLTIHQNRGKFADLPPVKIHSQRYRHKSPAPKIKMPKPMASPRYNYNRYALK